MSWVSALEGFLVGFAFGAFVSYLVERFTNRALLNADNKNNILGISLARQFCHVATLLVVFLLRNRIPLPFVPLILGTAVGISILSIALAFRTARQVQAQDETVPAGEGSAGTKKDLEE